MALFKLDNPIPETVKDRDELTEAIRKWQGIPYYGTTESTSHTFLDLLSTLTEMSNTFRSCVNDMNKYIFGQRITFVKGDIPGMQTDVEELSSDAQLEYFNWLKERNISPRHVLQMSRRINWHLYVNGNSYLLIRRIEVGSTVRYEMKVIHYKHFMYRKSEDIGQEFGLISKFLDDPVMLEKHPPKILPVTLNGEAIVWENIKPGVEEAIIHFKKEDQDGESDFYARPDILSVLTWLYVDFQLGNLNSKVAATELITKKILAFQAPDPATVEEGDEEDEEILEELSEQGIAVKKRKNTQFHENMMVLKNLVTNISTHPTDTMGGRQASSIAGIQFPFSGQPPTAIDLEMNRDTTHQEFQLDKAVTCICANLGWSPELLMIRRTTTTLGGNLLYDIFTMKNESTIRPRANTFEDFWNGILEQIRERENAPRSFDGYGIRFPDVITEMIDRFKGTGGRADIGENPVRDQSIDDNGTEDTDDTTVSNEA